MCRDRLDRRGERDSAIIEDRPKKNAVRPQKFLSWWLNVWMSVGVTMPCFKASFKSVSDQPLP